MSVEDTGTLWFMAAGKIWSECQNVRSTQFHPSISLQPMELELLLLKVPQLYPRAVGRNSVALAPPMRLLTCACDVKCSYNKEL